ncbi:hypothetical protein ACFX2C_023086 [Malus domestica]
MAPTRASSKEFNHNSQKLHTLNQDSVKQNQFMVPTRASSIKGNHNSQKLHTLLIKTVRSKTNLWCKKQELPQWRENTILKSFTFDKDSVKQNQFIVPTRASSKEFNHNSQKFHS